jgi:hypothetical protein
MSISGSFDALCAETRGQEIENANAKRASARRRTAAFLGMENIRRIAISFGPSLL